MSKHIGFIVDKTYRVENGKTIILLFGRLSDGRSFVTRNAYAPYFFIKQEDEKAAKEILSSTTTFTGTETTTLTSFDEKTVCKISFSETKDVARIRDELEKNGMQTFEADIPLAQRFTIDLDLLSTVLITGKETHTEEFFVDVVFEEPELAKGPDELPTLRILSFDIETDKTSNNMYSIALAFQEGERLWKKTIFVHEGHKQLPRGEDLIIVTSQKDAVQEFIALVQKEDPDLITGWNLIDFDFAVLNEAAKRERVDFSFGRMPGKLKLTQERSFFRDSKASIPGREILDGIHLLKSSFIKLDNYKLNTAAKEFTDEKKLIETEGKEKYLEITRLYQKEPSKLIAYNELDAKLVLDVLANSGVLALTLRRSLITGMQPSRVKASIASFDSLYLRELRKRGKVAPSVRFQNKEEKTVGGFVMNPKPGLYQNVFVFDFKSLYPSIMITFNIDPLALASNGEIRAPNGVRFSKKEGILPAIIKHVWSQRDKAKARKDASGSYAFKILMNSLYGVLASQNCRFYDPALANAITSFGHHLIATAAKFAEQEGYKVIYGDTDSVFVATTIQESSEALEKGKTFGEELNAKLTAHIKNEFGRENHTELEFEKLYAKLLLVRARGGTEGAKKRYAGVNWTPNNETLEITGLEAVRGDWTELAGEFQEKLLHLLFQGSDPTTYIQSVLSDLQKGLLDDKLIYRKNLRKTTEEYTKTTPPHVKAARKMGMTGTGVVEYVMTTDGPEPLQQRKARIDYDHYVEKQLEPIAESLLASIGKDFSDIRKGSVQKGLFDF
ncbi:MAG: DNA polymerase II [Candidatus Woesearchaeota archaeon]|nr:MAG: DNA polymerase II [Candidatus Woesearchaeota archaeon]